MVSTLLTIDESIARGDRADDAEQQQRDDEADVAAGRAAEELREPGAFPI